MPKPYMPLFLGDLWREPGVRAMSCCARGGYFSLLFALFDADGELEGDHGFFRRLAGAEITEWARIWKEIQMAKVLDIIVTCDDNTTDGNEWIRVKQRRIFRDATVRKQTRSRVARHRERKSNAIGNAPVQQSNGHSSISSSISSSSLEKQFTLFWEEYPLKKAKKKAKEKWKRLAPDENLQATILQAVQDQKQWGQWKRGIIPLASTWLNQERWNDEEPPGERPRQEEVADRARRQALEATQEETPW